MGENHMILRNDWAPILREMKDADAGKLLKTLYSYHLSEEIPSDLSPECRMFFLMAKPFFDRNREKYRATCERNRKNGARGGRPRKDPSPEEGENDESFDETSQNEAQKNPAAFSETQNSQYKENENVILNENDIEKLRERGKYQNGPSRIVGYYKGFPVDQYGYRASVPARGLPSNVHMFQHELEELQADFPKKWRDLIEHFSLYLINNPEKHYNDHFRTILEWAEKDGLFEE